MPTPDDACTRCDCIESMVSVRDISEPEGYKLIECPCICHASKGDRETWEAESRADAKREGPP
mgnify:CR=1 FL=1